MAKTTIINVEVKEELNTAYVTYSTGTEKLYPANKLPKTVQTWIEKHPVQEPEQEPEKIDLDDDSQTMYLDLYAEGATWHPVDGAVEREPEAVEEAVEAVVKQVSTQASEHVNTQVRKLPATTQKPELTVPVEADIVKDNSMGAAEAVAFVTCIAMAIAFWGIVGLIQVLAAGIETLACWAWSRREQAASGCRIAAGWIGSGAKALAACLPAVTTKRGLAVAVRALPVLIGLMAIM